MTPVEILKAAKAKIADPKNWCQGQLAKDADGLTAYSASVEACQWCAEGAIVSVTGLRNCETFQFLRTAGLELYALPPFDVNDTGTHADVMAMFDRAIVLAEASS